MRIERKRNLQRLINSRKNGQIKIITGVRRCGKSYLLGVLYRDYLIQEGVFPEQIIMLELDNDINIRYRNPIELGQYLRDRVSNTEKDYYILLDEIQMVESIDNPYLPKESGSKVTFVDVLLGLRGLPNVDVYVTGYGANINGIDTLLNSLCNCNASLYVSNVLGLNNSSYCETIGLIRLNYKKISQNKYMNLQNNNYNDIIVNKEKNSKFDKFILDEEELD